MSQIEKLKLIGIWLFAAASITTAVYTWKLVTMPYDRIKDYRQCPKQYYLALGFGEDYGFRQGTAADSDYVVYKCGRDFHMEYKGEVKTL